MKIYIFSKGVTISSFMIISLIIFSSFFFKQVVKHVKFDVEAEVAYQELSPNYVWFHPRAAAIPGYGNKGNPAVIMTIQKHLVVSDYYSGLYFMRTDNLGETWSKPIEIPELAWQYESDGTTVSVADVTPGWHEKSGKLIAIGIKVRYSKEGTQIFEKPRSHDAAYTVFDPVTNLWTPWKMVHNIPEPNSKFYLVNPGCVQWLVKPNGNILLPVYFSGSHLEKSSVCVLECSFDGSTLTYLQHGNELSVDMGRGLGEPSLVLYKGTYFLTIRNDMKAYVSISKDGLNWDLPIPWKFDDGEDLGSYNTQAHWLVHSEGLFLTYTRKGANNDHIARNRAPIFIAQVDPENRAVIRSTEQTLIPERGVMLGNFGASAITDYESWVTDAEFMIGTKPHPLGADGSVWIAKVKWAKRNKIFK
ncbi:MAG: sialidase family protein [Dysgonamonadaceae bacterium]|nr:sialidase family protein [Dysgonamonadaceae bacterium]MDD4727433.1 sialidase family protein [Dysgonamonadaceae bacterium]